MKKTLLFSTMLLAATSALAFGGIFNNGHKSTTYKGGLNAIGVHFGGEGKADIKTTCPEHSEWVETECKCESGWEMDGNTCRPNSKPVCDEAGMYWCPTAQSCVANAAACLDLCPEDRKCGPEGSEVCCGEGNVCVDDAYCCFKDYEDNGGIEDSGMCCSISDSTGYSTNDGCCGEGSSPYATYSEGGGDYVETSCCSGSVIRTTEWEDGYNQECCANGKTIEYNGVKACDPECGEGEVPYISYYGSDDGVSTECCAGTPYQTYDDIGPDWTYFEQQCCDSENIHTGVGYKGWDVCCDHDPQNYAGYHETGFKVCWNGETACKTNAECGDGEYCNLVNDGDPWTCNYPNQGTCEEIGGGSPAAIEGLGEVVKSDNYMTWWAADNWCKAQGMRLVTIEEIGCHYSGTNNPIEEGAGQWGYCCKGGGAECDYWYDHWDWSARTMDDTEDDYSPVIVELAKAYGNNHWLWTSSDFSPNSSCDAFTVSLNRGAVRHNRRNNGRYALCVE